jgi:hypothetical protein
MANKKYFILTSLFLLSFILINAQKNYVKRNNTSQFKAHSKDSIINIKIDLSKKIELKRTGVPIIQIRKHYIGDTASTQISSLPKSKIDTLFRFVNSLITIVTYDSTIILNAIVPARGSRSTHDDADGKSFFMIYYPNCDKDFEMTPCDFPLKGVKLTLFFDCKVNFSLRSQIKNSMQQDKEQIKKILHEELNKGK